MILWRFPKNLFILRGIYWVFRTTFTSMLKVEPFFRPLRKFLNRPLGIFKE
jgi:hypothetical protein